jgi:hypothetical protein
MICFCWRNARLLVLLTVHALCLSRVVDAAVFMEDFDNPSPPDGRVLYDAGPHYDAIAGPLTGGNSTGNTFENGRIIPSYLGLILADQSGSGFFLQSRTGGGGGPFTEEVWGTTTLVAVTPDTLYEFSFYLTNENTINNAMIQPFINGMSVGSAVSAVGTFLSHGWQQFTFLWNSGTATTADLSLANLTPGGGGNDFGVDTINFASNAAVPEPTALMIWGGLAGLGLLLAQKRARSDYRPVQ